MTPLQTAKDRIRQIASELTPGCEVRFDEETEASKFVIHSSTGTLLIAHSEDRSPEEWLKLSEDEIRTRLKLLSHGLM
jgi:hypothetical protein